MVAADVSHRLLSSNTNARFDFEMFLAQVPRYLIHKHRMLQFILRLGEIEHSVSMRQLDVIMECFSLPLHGNLIFPFLHWWSELRS